MSPGLIVSDRPFSPPPWENRFRSFRKYRSRLVVVPGSFRSIRLGTIFTLVPKQCGDIEMTGYLENVRGPVPLVVDLHITHELFGSSSHPSVKGHLHYPDDVDRSLHEDVVDKIRKYHDDYTNNPPNVLLQVKKPYPLLRGVRDGTRYNIPFTVLSVRKRSSSCRLLKSVCLSRLSRSRVLFTIL